MGCGQLYVGGEVANLEGVLEDVRDRREHHVPEEEHEERGEPAALAVRAAPPALRTAVKKLRIVR